ncbi:MAG: HAD-IIIC family phosphatase, partial [Balneolaceae bacterium]
VTLKPGIVELIQTLDERGILQSVASKNDEDMAVAKLKQFGLMEYFLYPQINWNPKSGSLRKIAEQINIGLDTLAFVDDQAFEREEVQFSHPEILVIDSLKTAEIADMEVMIPRFITDDSRKRRQMYQSDIVRNEVEKEFDGSQDLFLSTLDMVLTISEAKTEDLKRAEELTQRTNQLNTTAYTYDYDELAFFSRSPDHLLLVAGLTDKFGTYGKIGLVLVDKQPDVWTVKLLLMSCRVMSRGVGTVLITFLRNLAKEEGVALEAEFVTNDRNRMMYVTYKFNQFREKEKKENWVLLENDLENIPAYPDYMKIVTEGV